jgi:hypothetical protein
MNKQLLIDGIVGKNFLSYEDAVKYERLGLARFSGNQWNEDWDWLRERLEKLTEEELITIYQRSK